MRETLDELVAILEREDEVDDALRAVVTALAATVLGSIAAYAVVTGLMDLPFAFSWRAVGGALLTAAALVLAFGALGTWRVLSARPVPYLRTQ